MFHLKIVLEEVDIKNDSTNRELRKIVSWPSIPRPGEVLAIGGNCYPVTEVMHELDKDPTSSEAIWVRAKWWEADFKTLSEEDPAWEKCGF